MVEMRKVNTIVSIFLIALSVGAYTMAANFPSLANDHTGPGSFPKILAVIIIILSIILALQSFLKKEEPTEALGKIKPAAVAMAIVFGYLIAINFLGFFIITPVVIMLFLVYAKVRNWMLYVGLPTGVIIFIYFLFEKMLKVPLPDGQLFM
jgi:putative tricarboxylic transport membrane protein